MCMGRQQYYIVVTEIPSEVLATIGRATGDG